MSTRFYPNLVMARSLYINSDNKYLNAIGALLFGFVTILIIYDKDIKILLNNLLKVATLLFPNLFFICLLVCHGEWHMGILFLILIFLAIILKSLQKNKILYAMIFVLMIMQVYWAYDTSMYDINNEFSSGEAASNYIKEIGYENKTICAVDYWSVQVNIYFDENINTNYAESKAYFPWKKEYADYIFSNNIIKNDELYDIYIIPKIYFYKYETNGKDYYMDTNNYFDFENLIRKNLLNTGLYEEKYFESNMYAKGKLVENTGLYVLVRKD
jgi:hypothetical protein